MSPGSTAASRLSWFAQTRWSVVLVAGDPQSPQVAAALQTLCCTYWYPLYTYVRRRGYSPEDAQDLTQEFFARLLAHNWVADADPARGRFRTFLLTALSRFLANEWHRAGCQKRGSHQPQLPLDTACAEARYQSESVRAATPDQVFDRQWAITLLDQALSRLAIEHEQAGKTAEFELLSPVLTADRGAIAYATLARDLNVSETAARMAVHRFRKRFRELFREAIAQTVANPHEVEAETRYLLSALAQ